MSLKPKLMDTHNSINFMDLQSQQKVIRESINRAIQKVLDKGDYILGEAVSRLEEELATFCGARYAIGCSNGTDAIAMVLRAQNIGPGDAVFVPAFTFCATAEVVVWLGAVPIFVDVLEDTYNMDPKSLAQGIEQAKKLGLNPKAVIPVDLFGQPADYDSIADVARDHSLWILADAAQSFGSSYKSKKVGTLGFATTTSFYPAKPLGCYGDGGGIFTDDPELANALKSIRVHGQGSHKYDNIRIGINGRLDTLQAAILLEKLKIFPDEIKSRQKIAALYSEAVADVVDVPRLIPEATSVWALYTIKLPDGVDRNDVQKQLQARNIPTVVYYPLALSEQEAYRRYPTATGNVLQVSKKLSETVLSLPMHAYLTESQAAEIVESLKDSLKGR